MHPKNRAQRGIALHAIADTAEKMERSGADQTQVSNFIAGAREKLSEEVPDLDTRAKAAAAATRWARTNI